MNALVPVLPNPLHTLHTLRRALAEALVEATVVSPVEPQRRVRERTDRRLAGERRKLRAQWPDRLERRGSVRRGGDAAQADDAAREGPMRRTAAARKGMIIDVFV